VTDFGLKVPIALISVISAICGATASVIVFFWIEGRRRYMNQLAGVRVLVLISESIYAVLRAGRKDVSELKLEWVLEYLDGVFRDEDAFNILRGLIELRSELLSEHSDGANLSILIDKADRLKIASKQCLRSHVGRWRGRWYFVAR